MIAKKENFDKKVSDKKVEDILIYLILVLLNIFKNLCGMSLYQPYLIQK